MHNVEDLLGKFADTSYPFLIAPRLLEHPDPFIANCFRGELKRHQPELWEWKWMDGNSCEIKELPKEKFHDPAMWYINQEYRIGCGRLKESFEHSYLINWVDLGNGYRIHVAGYCPETMTRKYEHVFLVDFLYRKKDWHGKESHDGVIRLRRFLNYLQEMPDNPYSIVIIHPAGQELMRKRSPHLSACNYKTTEHSTKELVKLYKYWLKAVRTKQVPNGGSQWQDDTYYRVECYKPKFPMHRAEECPFPLLLENA
jgi:hypothetical protein